MGRFLPGKAMLALVHLWYSEQKTQGDGPDRRVSVKQLILRMA